MTPASGSQSKPGRTPWANWVLFFSLLALLPFGFYVWLLSLDSAGTFYVSASFVDIDDDGDQDVIAQNLRQEAPLTGFGGPVIWENQGDRTFTRLPFDLPLGEVGGWDSTVADIDQDGDPDLLRFVAHALSIDINQGGAQNGPPGDFKKTHYISDSQIISQFGSVEVGDVNGDGWLDALVAGTYEMAIQDDGASPPGHSWVWFNGADSETRRKSKRVVIPDLTDISVSELALGDLDGDGDLDLFAAVQSGPDAAFQPGSRVLINNGAGVFSDTGQRLGRMDGTSVTLADVDGDSDLDALVGTGTGAELWLNLGGAQAGKSGTYLLSDQAFEDWIIRRVFLADLDQDGDADAVLGGVTSATLWWNDGQGRFVRSNRSIRYTRRHGLAVGDVNGDGWPDIWVGKYDNQMKVWYNQRNGTFR